MEGSARRRVVGRLRKAHGLHGDCVVFPLTDDPAAVFAPGRMVWVVDPEGEPITGPIEITRSRRHHREWLIGFGGYGDRSMVEAWGGMFLAVPAEVLQPLGEDEVYVDELEGFAVRDGSGRALGLVTGWYELPGGLTLEVQGPKREFLLPFKKGLVRQVDRGARRMTVELPEGLLEL